MYVLFSYGFPENRLSWLPNHLCGFVCVAPTGCPWLTKPSCTIQSSNVRWFDNLWQEFVSDVKLLFYLVSWNLKSKSSKQSLFTWRVNSWQEAKSDILPGRRNALLAYNITSKVYFQNMSNHCVPLMSVYHQYSLEIHLVFQYLLWYLYIRQTPWCC